MKDIYTKLLEAVEALPPEAVERAKKEVTRKGYDTTGYQYQYLVNVMNEVLGIDGWTFTFQFLKDGVSQTSSGRTMYEVTVATTVIIKDKDTQAERTCAGGHISMAYADAYKGAITNSLKKTLALFGVGKKAYEGTIDEDYLPIPEATTPKPVNTPKPW
jgi:recombination DNA repair RAD52 pathway protein